MRRRRSAAARRRSVAARRRRPSDVSRRTQNGAGIGGLSERSAKRSTGSRGTTHAAAPAVISSTSD